MGHQPESRPRHLRSLPRRVAGSERVQGGGSWDSALAAKRLLTGRAAASLAQARRVNSRSVRPVCLALLPSEGLSRVTDVGGLLACDVDPFALGQKAVSVRRGQTRQTHRVWFGPECLALAGASPQLPSPPSAPRPFFVSVEETGARASSWSPSSLGFLHHGGLILLCLWGQIDVDRYSRRGQ